MRSSSSLRLSPTALDSFLRCPKQYDFAYQLRAERAESASPTLVAASAVHAALADLHRIPLEERSEQRAHDLLRHHWGLSPARAEAFWSESHERQSGEQAMRALSWYCSHYELSVIPRAIEDWVRAPLPGGHTVYGKVDRVDDRADGGLDVIDYKTGNCRLEDYDLGAEPSAQVYAVAASHSLHRPVRRVRFLYLTAGVERRWELEPEDLQAATEALDRRLLQVARETDFEARPDFHCRWCAFASQCPERHTPPAGSTEPAEPEAVPF